MRRPGKATVAIMLVAGSVGLVAGGAFLLSRSGGTTARPACPRDVAGTASPTSASGAAVTVAIDVPSAVAAGTPALVRVTVTGEPDGSPVRLLVARGDAPATRDLVLADGLAAVTLDTVLTATAGPLDLQAWSCHGHGAARLTVLPGPATGTLLPHVGPKRIRTGSGETATIVVLPQDAHGNAVADGTDVDYDVRRPGGALEAHTIPTAHLLGVLRLAAGDVVGRTEVAARVGRDVRGSSAQLLETAGLPAPGFPVSIEGPLRAPVGSQDRRVVLRDLTDAHGNRLEDGLLVEVLVTEPDGTMRTEQAPLIAGGIDVPLDSPAVPGTVTVRLSVSGVESAAATIVYDPPAVAVPVPLDARYDPATRAIAVTVGPVIGDLGAFAPDGSEVVVTASGSRGWVDERILRLTDGAATVTIPVEADETSVHLFVRSAFGRTEASVTVAGGVPSPTLSPDASATPRPATTPPPAGATPVVTGP